MRDSRFASTFEDDEYDASSDIHDSYDDRFGGNTPSAIGSGLPPGRGRSFAADMTRSRSQSLATANRPGTIGSPFAASLWNDSGFTSGSGPLSIPGSRYNDLKTPGGSRYGSLGALGRSPSNGYSHGPSSFTDHSNMSPFVRDVGQILLDDGSAFRDLWGAPPARDENGGGSGTTSRRHSVSIVQPRRPTVVGFNAPGADSDEPALTRPGVFNSAFNSASGGASGGLLLTDDDLASDLGALSLGYQDERIRQPGTPSAPSSLPIYAPLSRSPPAPERLSPYQALHLNIPGPGNANSFAARQSVGSPSDSGFSAGSPSRNHFDNEPLFGGARDSISSRQGLTARFVPGKGIQHIPETGILNTPIRAGAYGQPAMQRRPSDAAKGLNDLGKGVPLHSVPTSWPLYIIEFKAGRTDLFYCTDLSLDIRVGDLVIVEADRGKDLGKVVNDTITLAEVEAFQKQQKMLSGYAEAQGQVPTSPTGGAKEINPKMIYGKAQAQDTQ